MAKETDVQRITKRYVQRLARSITVNKAILTGSWATGRNLEDSDVDLIIVSDDFSRMPISERLSYLQKKWTSKIPLEAFGYTMDEFRQLRQRSTYVKDAVRNGLVLAESGSSRTKSSGLGSARGIGLLTKHNEIKSHD
jgi:predicted nucleotidyltransferase